jgi:sugar lactone lactonase YvrE
MLHRMSQFPAVLRGGLCVVAMLVASTALAEDWQYPLGVTRDGQGRILIADKKFHGVLVLADGKLTPLYQGSNKFRTPLNAVYCIHTAADGTVYVGDSATRDVYAISADGKLRSLTSGQGDNVPKEEYHPGKIGIPTQLATNKAGDVFATDLELQRVWRISKEGEVGEFVVAAGARGVAVDSEDHVWVLCANAPQLRRFSPDGKTSEEIVKDVVFEFPHQVAVKADGTAFVTDGYAKALWKVEKGQAPVKIVSGDPFVNPVGLFLEANGEKALVLDPRAPGLFEVTMGGKINKLYPAATAP